jgi:death-on-curing protein
MPPFQPKFLSVEQVLELHRQVIEHYGGLGGVRDLGLLEAAVSMPAASFHGELLHPTLAQVAGAYLFHLDQAQAFHDGNKRIAALAAIVFLDVNGYELRAGTDELERLVMDVAAGRAGKGEAATFFKRHTRRKRARR